MHPSEAAPVAQADIPPDGTTIQSFVESPQKKIKGHTVFIQKKLEVLDAFNALQGTNTDRVLQIMTRFPETLRVHQNNCDSKSPVNVLRVLYK